MKVWKVLQSMQIMLKLGYIIIIIKRLEHVEINICSMYWSESRHCQKKIWDEVWLKHSFARL